jgi:hypothetical protein
MKRKRSVLSIIFGPTKENVTGQQTHINKEKLHNFYSSQNMIRIINHISMGKTCRTFGTDEFIENVDYRTSKE